MRTGSIIFFLFFFSSSTILWGQSMQWVFLANGVVNGSCTSTSDCSNEILCYGLEYTPAISGTITSYTTGFFVDCTAPNNGNGNPIESNSACIMTDNSALNVQCSAASLVLLNSSGNSGTSALVANTPIILHQICLDLSANQSVNIVEDDATDLSVSIDEAGGGPVNELPSYSTFNASYNDICNAMAIELAGFSANRVDQQSVLKWETALEIDNDYFSIEWSRDGRSFQEIGKTTGAGTSNRPNNYQFIHQRPAGGINYYRLKAIEFDGDAEYSPIRLVQLDSDGKKELHLYPNPARDHLSLGIPPLVQGQQITIEIRSLTGQLLLSTQPASQSAWLDLSLEQLRPASYLLILKSARESYISRFIKTE